MLKLVSIILRKDFLLIAREHGAFLQSLLLGMLLIFIFSLAHETGTVFTQAEASTIFWISSIFCSVLIFNQLYSYEYENGILIFFSLSPYPIQGLWLAKTVMGFIVLALIQIFLFAACFVFLAQNPYFPGWPVSLSLVCCDFGLCCLGSLLSAICQGTGSRDSLLSILFFPLLTPMALAGINLGTGFFGNPEIENSSFWVGIIFSFSTIYIACGLLLSSFAFKRF